GGVTGLTVPAVWSPYGETLAIDGAGGVFLVGLDDLPADEAAKVLASELHNARACGLTAVVLTVAPQGQFWLTDAAFEKTKRDMAAWRAKIAEHADVLLLVEHSGDLERARRERRLGVIFTFQGTEPLGEDVKRIPMYRELGVRVIQLTHNRHNLVGDGSTELGNAGLSNYGREVVAQLNAAKIVVDLAHGAQRTTREGILASKAPPIISHTGCRALADLPRNTGDAELRLLADRGGVAGMIFWPYLRTDTQPMAIDVARHIEHAIQVCGEDHVGIGTDSGVSPVERTPAFEADNREFVKSLVEQGILTGGRPAELYTFIPDLNVANRFERLGGLLAARGHSSARIAKVLGGNFARVFREVWG
ncbi:MAG: membrane dipeptidase, partial [Myxococcales bacterium]|nr:membrane dipeptidase [Myxococcales bacterium]